MFGIEEELKVVLKEIEAYETIGELDRRQTSVFSAVNIARALGYKAGYRPLGTVDGHIIEDPQFPIPEWASPICAFINLPTGQVAYFIKDEGVAWDNHTRPVKLERIKKYLNTTIFEGELG